MLFLYDRSIVFIIIFIAFACLVVGYPCKCVDEDLFNSTVILYSSFYSICNDSLAKILLSRCK
ncbi:hypothetical protein NECAME_18860 [Necator americanus]|uniref:Uncharacterized protein n=1 Tax=Necator americanus TaxID=51031 RepID=W2SSE2_NECAM|nr:hypothetical protein NECAME_18860 [Necator americanus]ETN72423.1 hypothetical protein NECAME_18860 [Necator americanus]